MKVRKYIKRMAAFAATASMVGATLSAGLAADLSEYPAPFVQDGKFNALIVVGEAAASVDVLGSVAIATDLQFASKTVQKVAGTTTVDVEGDAWQIGTSTKVLEISENLDSSGVNSENIYNITTFIEDTELGALADGVFENSQGTFDYEQFIYWDNRLVGTVGSQNVIYTENTDTDITADFFYVKSGENVGRYALEFKSSAKSDVTDVDGTADTSGTYLFDYQSENLAILGKTYSIVTARRTTAARVNSVKLTLMGGAIRDILDEGTSKTYTLEGTDYDVTLDFVGSTTASFTVNNERTRSMLEGNTDTLVDGRVIGVHDVLAQEFAGGTRRAEFFLGADKVVLADTDISDTASSDTLEVGDSGVDGVDVIIAGSDDNSTFKIDSITLNVTAEEDLFVPAGGKISEEMSNSEGLLGSWDIEYHGLSEPQLETIGIDTSGSDQYVLNFADGSGNQVSVPFAYTSGGTNLHFGDDDDDLIIDQTQIIGKNDYFILTDTTKDAGERPTFALRYKGSDKSSKSNPQINFDLLGSSSDPERPYSIDTSTGAMLATIKLAGATYNVYNASSPATKDFDLYIDLDGDGSLLNGTTGTVLNTENGDNLITSHGGAQIALANNTGRDQGDVLFTLSTPDTDDYENLAPTNVVFNITAASAEVSLAEVGTHNFKKPEGEDNTQYAYTTMGAFMKFVNPTGDPGELTIEYPGEQRVPLAFVTSGATTSASGETGGVESTTINEVGVDAAVLDSDPAVDGKETDNNLIIVGGPAANSAAAAVMGLPFPSFGAASTIPENAAIIKLVEHENGNVALVVAGWRAEDTLRASRVLANHETHQEEGTLAGKEVQVTGTSLTDLTVGAVVMEEEDVGEAMEEDGDAMEEGGDAEGEA